MILVFKQFVVIQNNKVQQKIRPKNIADNVCLPTTFWPASAGQNVLERNERMRVKRRPKKEPKATDERGQRC